MNNLYELFINYLLNNNFIKEIHYINNFPKIIYIKNLDNDNMYITIIINFDENDVNISIDCYSTLESFDFLKICSSKVFLYKKIKNISESELYTTMCYFDKNDNKYIIINDNNYHHMNITNGHLIQTYKIINIHLQKIYNIINEIINEIFNITNNILNNKKSLKRKYYEIEYDFSNEPNKISKIDNNF